MSNLVAIAYPDVDTAQEVMGTLGRLQVERSIELEDAVIVTREDGGKVKLHQARSTTGAGAAGGALWGGLIGLLFLAPLLGMAVGAASGALTRQADRRRRGRLVPQGARREARAGHGRGDRARPPVDARQGDPGDPGVRRHVLQSSLDNEAEARLQEALQAQGTAA